MMPFLVYMLFSTTIENNLHSSYKRDDFSFEIPRGWKVANEDEIDQLSSVMQHNLSLLRCLIVRQTTSSQDFTENITIIRNSETSRQANNQLSYYAQLYQSFLGKEAHEYHPLKLLLIEDQNARYIRIEHLVRFESQSPLLKQWIAIFPLAGYSYTVTLTGLEENQKQLEIIFDDFVRSFRLAEKDSPYFPARWIVVFVVFTLVTVLILPLVRLQKARN